MLASVRDDAITCERRQGRVAMQDSSCPVDRALQQEVRTDPKSATCPKLSVPFANSCGAAVRRKTSVATAATMQNFRTALQKRNLMQFGMNRKSHDDFLF